MLLLLKWIRLLLSMTGRSRLSTLSVLLPTKYLVHNIKTKHNNTSKTLAACINSIAMVLTAEVIRKVFTQKEGRTLVVVIIITIMSGILI